MSASLPARPVARSRVAAGTIALLVVLAGFAGLAEMLRNPATIAPEPEPPDADDPRDEVECAPPASAPGEPIPVQSDDLYDCPHLYDGRAVRYEGEVIGAVLRRADGAWAQLNDDAYAGDLGPLPAHRQFRGGNAGVGVHLPGPLADRIEWIGAHGSRGDVLAVTGIYHQSETASGEVAVIRAAAGEITAPGQPASHRPLQDRRVVGSILAAAALALVAAARIRARRR